jgi:S-adenosylmethionine hydrolase
MSRGVITFTSDFGTKEYYVGAVKGSVLSVNPDARIVDLSHDIPSHDLLGAAFTVLGSYGLYPPGTVHLIIVDPGVGSKRRGLLVATEKYLFVAPDNGVLSLVYQREDIRQVVSIEAEHYFRQPVAPTFHGRDIFGPVAGYLSRGIEASKFGPPITDYVKLTLPDVKEVGAGVLEGFVLHVDKFGNIITSIREEDIAAKMGQGARPRKFVINDQEITKHVSYYSEGDAVKAFSLIGSSGFFEIASLKKSAARVLEVKRGMKVTAEFQA